MGKRKRGKDDQQSKKKQKTGDTSQRQKRKQTLEKKENSLKIQKATTQEEIDARILEEVKSRKKTCPYTQEQSILILGDGDLSFSSALARLGYTHLTPTVYIDKEKCLQQYSTARSNINCLEHFGIPILFSLDALKLSTEPRLKNQLFDVVIFNFPHTGVPNYDDASILSNQNLLTSLFTSVPYVLTRNGEFHVSLKSEPVYNSWRILEQCSQAYDIVVETSMKPLKIKHRRKFQTYWFVGYTHVATSSQRSVASNDCYVWIFGPESKEWESPKLKSVGPLYEKGMFKCRPCKEQFDSKKRLELHLQSRKHRDNTGEEKYCPPVVSAFQCPTCRPVVRCNTQKHLDEHLKSRKHLRKCKSLAKRVTRERKQHTKKSNNNNKSKKKNRKKSKDKKNVDPEILVS